MIEILHTILIYSLCFAVVLGAIGGIFRIFYFDDGTKGLSSDPYCTLNSASSHRHYSSSQRNEDNERYLQEVDSSIHEHINDLTDQQNQN